MFSTLSIFTLAYRNQYSEIKISDRMLLVNSFINKEALNRTQKVMFIIEVEK